MYRLCKGMEWNHLPVAGGIYDQHPRFVDSMMLLMDIDNRIESERNKKRERDQKAKAAASKGRRGRR
jgi:hypothetical protein